MRYGIVSDIHGNLAALHASLAFLRETMGVERLVCLGDIVGYNADPDACADVLQASGALSITGNHDLIATGALGFERCAVRPAFALKRTRQAISPATAEALRELPARRVIEGEIAAVHGGVRDVCQYVTSPADVLENDALLRMDIPEARICLFGHTHERRLWEVQNGSVTRRGEVESKDAVEIDLSGASRRYFLNPGSVDAARKKGEYHAEVAILDTTRSRLSFHRVPYDAQTSERRAKEQGYRMGPIEERLHKIARDLSQKRAGVARRLHRLWAP